MSDLVERLRAGPGGKHDPLIYGEMQEAADEIERLRADRDAMSHTMGSLLALTESLLAGIKYEGDDGARAQLVVQRVRRCLEKSNERFGQKEAADEDWGCSPLTSGEEAKDV